jgi:hypothetical protein
MPLQQLSFSKLKKAVPFFINYGMVAIRHDQEPVSKHAFFK